MEQVKMADRFSLEVQEDDRFQSSPYVKNF